MFTLATIAITMFADLDNNDLFFVQQVDVSNTNTEPDLSDITEGFAAFKDVLDNFGPTSLGPRNLDLGGGQFDTATIELAKIDVQNNVADLFGRSKVHNKKVLEAGPYDSMTSFSVLNVIDTDTNRYKHIELSHRLLKAGGCAYFKIWEGDATGTAFTDEDSKRHQENKKTKAFLPFVEEIYVGSKIACVEDQYLIVACKP